jgi:DNA-binding winged helix-turn-helix (wHTH) protein
VSQQVPREVTFVDFERSINLAINQIRSALGDNAERPRFIETVPRLGYRFLPAVEFVEVAPPQVASKSEDQVSVSAPSMSEPLAATAPPGFSTLRLGLLLDIA